MSVLSSQTRKQLRQTIGYDIRAMLVSTTTSAGATNAFIDTELPNADGSQNGKHFVQTDGLNDGSIRIIDEFIGGPKQGRFRTAMANVVASGVAYELWDPDIPPARVHDAINAAIRTITRKGAPPTTNISVHTSRRLKSYTIPTAVVGIQRVEYRVNHNREEIDTADAVWSELVDTDVTAVLDDEDYRQGSGSNRFALAAGLGVGDIIASEATGTLDLSGMTHVEFWMKSSVTTVAADLQLILSTTASAGTETELLSIPVLTAGVWQFVRVALANPESDTAIISVGLKHTADIGAATIWIDGIEATENDSGTWEYVHRNYWRIDKSQRKLVFDWEGSGQVGYSLLKLIGVKKPTELTSDTTSCDVEPQYIIKMAHASLLRGRGDRNANNREAAHIEADRLQALAFKALQSVQSPSGMRWCD